jgi:hypothetical protein
MVRRRLLPLLALAVLVAGVLAGQTIAAGPTIVLTPTSGPAGTSVSVKGTGFGAREPVAITFDARQVGSALTDALGRFAATIKVPTNATVGPHRVAATGSRSRRTAQATFTVTGGGGGVDWPQFRFDQAHTGFQPLETKLSASNVPLLQLKWQAQLGKLVDYSSPAVVGGVAYIGSTDGRLWAYPAAGCGQPICVTPRWRSTPLA